MIENQQQNQTMKLKVLEDIVFQRVQLSKVDLFSKIYDKIAKNNSERIADHDRNIVEIKEMSIRITALENSLKQSKKKEDLL